MEESLSSDPVQTEDRMTVGNWTEGLSLIVKKGLYTNFRSARKLASSRGSLMIKVTDSWPACHEFEPSTGRRGVEVWRVNFYLSRS
ncbi:hypothetical protein TNCV_1687471 [Trichonephila clavipes]|nr:hypothetical protein TNCV_1687471 [Trichonephila clavipes]